MALVLSLHDCHLCGGRSLSRLRMPVDARLGGEGAGVPVEQAAEPADGHGIPEEVVERLDPNMDKRAEKE